MGHAETWIFSIWNQFLARYLGLPWKYCASTNSRSRQTARQGVTRAGPRPVPQPAVFSCDRSRRHNDAWRDCCLRLTRYVPTSSLCKFVLYRLHGFLPVLMLHYFQGIFLFLSLYTFFCCNLGLVSWWSVLLYPDSFYNNRCFTYKLVVTSCTVLEEGRQNVCFWFGTQVNGLAVAPDCIIVFSFFKENIAFVFNWLSPFKRCLKNKCL